jgi:hypothetical protein
MKKGELGEKFDMRLDNWMYIKKLYRKVSKARHFSKPWRWCGRILELPALCIRMRIYGHDVAGPGWGLMASFSEYFLRCHRCRNLFIRWLTTDISKHTLYSGGNWRRTVQVYVFRETGKACEGLGLLFYEQQIQIAFLKCYFIFLRF